MKSLWGTTLDWKRNLGGDTDTIIPRIDGYYRFTPYHRFDFSWYKIALGGQKEVLSDVDFGDITIPSGFVVESQLNVETFKAAYNYSFYRAKEIEVAISAGVHTMKINTEIGANSDESTQDNAKFTAPLPVFGVNLAYSLSPKWSVYSRYDLFFIELDESYSGALSDYVLGLNFQAFNNVGFVLAANRFALDMEIDSGDYVGALDYLFNGVLFTVNVNY